MSSRSSAGIAAVWIASATTPAAAAPARRIVLPPLPLGDALLLLAQRSGRNILFRAADVVGKRSPAVDAAGFDDALDRIARHHRFVVTRLEGGAIRLAPAQLRPPPRPPVRRIVHAMDRPEPDRRNDEILVRGHRTGAEGVPGGHLDPDDVLRPSDIRRLPDRTVAEAMGRLPGVLTLATSLEGTMGRVDHAGRTIGDFVAVRGLPGSYLDTYVDGVELPQSLPYSRGAQLGLMASTPGTTLALRRVLFAAESGEAVAGRLAIDHAAPLAEVARGWQATASLTSDEQSRRFRQDATGAGGSIAYGTRVADGRLGLYLGASAAYRPFTSIEQTFQSGNIGFRHTDRTGRSAPGVDMASNLLLAAVNAQVTRGASLETDLHVGAGWSVDSRLTLTGRWTRATRRIDQDIYQISAQGGRSPAYFGRTPIGDGLFETESIRSDAHYWFQTNPERNHLTIAQLQMDWRSDALTLNGRLFTAAGSTDRPQHVEISFWDPRATALSGGVKPVYRGGLPLLDLPPVDAARLADPLAFPIRNQGERSSELSGNRRAGIELNGIAAQGDRSITFGATLIRSDRHRSTSHEQFSGNFAPGTSLGSTGLVSGSIGPLLPGYYDYRIPVIDRGALERMFDRGTPLPASLDQLRGGDSILREDKVAAYAAVTLPLGNAVRTVVGIRAQSVRLAGTFWLVGNNGVPTGTITYGRNAIHGLYQALLPSIGVKWQPRHDLTLGASLWTSQTRPSPYQLTGGGSVTQDNQGLVAVQLPNPGLRPVEALNLDASLHWQDGSGTQLTLSGFAKRLHHYLYDAGDTLNNIAPVLLDGTIRGSRAENAGAATIAGLEADATIALRSLADRLGPLSIGGNATLLGTCVRLRTPGFPTCEASQYAPALSGRAWVRYDDGHLSADIAYSMAGAYIQEYGMGVPLYGGSLKETDSALNSWVMPSHRMDAGSSITLNDVRVSLSIRNILNHIQYRSSIGRNAGIVPQSIIGARQLSLSVATSF